MLAEVAYQGHAQRCVQRMLSSGRVPHALLFHGPDGVGKELFARGLAQQLLCPQAVERSLTGETAARAGVERLVCGCDACEDCRAVRGGTHPDLHLVYRQLNREHPDAEVRRKKALDLGVDVLRHFVIDSVALTPQRGRGKVYIVREADRITTAAQNALLKTLEEPPCHTVIMLLATAPDRLMATTLSRCQLVRFDPLPTTFVEERLSAAATHSRAQLAWYARMGEGSAGEAVRLAEDQGYELNERLTAGLVRLREPSAPELEKRWSEEAKALGERLRARDGDITDTEAARRGLGLILRLTARWYADVLHVVAGDDGGVINKARVGELRSWSQCLDAERAAAMLDRLAEAERQLDLNANTTLVIESLLNDLRAA